MVICMYFLEADDVTAVRCLASFLMSKSRKKCADDSEVDIPHVLVEAMGIQGHLLSKALGKGSLDI